MADAITEPSTMERIMNLFRMKPSTDALKQASQTTQAPTTSEKSYTYDGTDYVRKAAEEAGRRNEAAMAQAASKNPASKPLQQHASGAITSPTGPGGTVGPSILGNYGRPSPVSQRTAQLPNPMPSVNAGPEATPPTQHTANLYRPGGPIHQAHMPPAGAPMGQQPPGPPPPPPPPPGQPGTSPVLNTGGMGGPPPQQQGAPPQQGGPPQQQRRRYGTYPMAG